MKEILSFQEKRIINILSALSLSENSMSVLGIQDMNDCSDRTVINDLEKISDLWGQKLQLSQLENTITIENRSTGLLLECIYDVLKDSLLSSLLLSIFFYPEEKIQFHADKVHISVSHAQRSLADLKTFLNKHKLLVSKNKGRHFLEGSSEVHLRFFMTQLLSQKQKIIDSFPNKDTMLELFDITHKAFKENGITLNALQVQEMTLALYISILREQQGFKLIDAPDTFKDLSFKLKHPFPFTKDEIRSGLELFSDAVFVYHQNLPLKERVLKHTNIAISNLSFKENITNIDTIAETIYVYMILDYANTVKLEKLLDRSLIFGLQCQKMYKDNYLEVNKQIEFLDLNLKNYIQRHLPHLIFWVSLERADSHIRNTKSILIVSDLGLKHASDLKSFLEQHFNHHYFDIESSLQGFSKELLDKFKLYDCIITTSPLNHDTEIPIVEISDFISQHDLSRIFMALR